MPDPKDLYYIAVKLFLVDGPPGGEASKLFIFKDKFGDWDLPGGRIRKDEFDTPLEEVIKRKILEELGDDVRYEIGKPVVFFRHERIENSSGQSVRIFAVGYEAKFLGGKIKLSELHTQSEWVDIATFKPEDYFTGGWLKGVKEYLDRHS
ncbi:MAG: NUDIX hydrolase [Patescibacteria group bacterium]